MHFCAQNDEPVLTSKPVYTATAADSVIMTRSTVGGIKQYCDPSRPSLCPRICLSHTPRSKTVHFSVVVYRSLIGNPMLEIEPMILVSTATGSGRETATKPSPAPLQKHSLSGCTIDKPPSNCHRRAHIVSPRDSLLARLSFGDDAVQQMQ